MSPTATRGRRAYDPKRWPSRWAEHTDEELLDLRMSRLGLSLDDAPVATDLERVNGELAARGIPFRPHAWLSSDFFSPDGVPGIALPFYLASPRLVRLERSQVLFAEGARRRERLRLLRHEAGHAVDTAYGLSRRADYRAAFGARSTPYRRHYTVDPASRAFVRYLPRWYAQSHPAEDFAETFAVWLDPGARWRSAYAGWPAAEKLELVDRMLAEVAGGRPVVRSRERTEALSGLPGSLRDHYARKRRRFAAEPPAPYEDELSAEFAPGRGRSHRSAAAAYLTGNHAGIAAAVRGPFRGDRYCVGQVLDGMRLRACELGLGLKPERRGPTLRRIAGVVARTLAELQRGRHPLCR